MKFHYFSEATRTSIVKPKLSQGTFVRIGRTNKKPFSNQTTSIELFLCAKFARKFLLKLTMAKDLCNCNSGCVIELVFSKSKKRFQKKSWV